MPIFDYLCPSCGERMEEVLVQRWDDDVECSDCGTVTKKLPAAPTIKSLDTPEKVSAALKKRSLNHSRKNKDEAIHHYNTQVNKARKKAQ
jgi:putative FmdB family regulatory protein